jgi:hypothetical protein
MELPTTGVNKILRLTSHARHATLAQRESRVETRPIRRKGRVTEDVRRRFAHANHRRSERAEHALAKPRETGGGRLARARSL